MKNVLSIFYVIIASYCLALAALLYMKKKNKPALNYLAAVQSVLAIMFFSAFLISGGELPDTAFPRSFSIALIFFIYPFFYLFVLRLAGIQSTRDYLHFILPFLILLAVIFKIRFIGPLDSISGTPGFMALDATDRLLIQTGILLNAVYFIVLHSVVAKYRRALKESYSSVEKMELNWLSAIIRLVSIVSLLYFSVNTVNTVLGGDFRLFLFIGEAACLSLIAIFLLLTAWFAFLQNEVALVSEEIRPGGKPGMPRYEKQRLPDSTERMICERLEKTMDDRKPFLDPELTLQGLSGITGIPSAQITMVLNIRLQQNFHRFVNSYRLRYACGLLRNFAYAEKSILEIAIESGFRSKTTFNSFFRTELRQTPREYRNAN